MLLCSADNLESHNIGGFSSCFSYKDICRFCHCLHSDLLDNIHDYDGKSMKSYWSKDEYDEICDTLAANDHSHSADYAHDQYFVTTGLVSSDASVSSSDDECDVNNERQISKFGLTRRCPFNRLQAFHAVSSLPPIAYMIYWKV